MTTLVLLLLLFLVLPLAAVYFGADSRGLRDHDWEVPWERLSRD
jgi:hypothetical protein